MKRIFISTLLLAIFFQCEAQNLLSGKYSRADLARIILPQSQWKPFPIRADKAGWAKADQEMLKANLKAAEGYIDYNWPYIPATKSLLIERTGDRNEYQSMSFEKRQVLGTLLLAEIYEDKGRFIDPIINGVWSICEESFWGAPAHLPKAKEYSGLIDVTKPIPELFSAETATYLAWVDYFLGDKLDAVSPQIRKRIYLETNNRIFQPLMTRPQSWMSTNANGRRPNNWNPWICSNWLNAALLLEKDESKRLDMVQKITSVLDQFLNPYPQDGGCDEGPGYWGAAAASLYDNLSLLNIASNDAFRYAYQDEKIKNMGRFIYRAQIGEKYFLNFADADPQPTMAGNMIYRYGKDIKDADMMRFGAHYRAPEDAKMERSHFFRNFFSLFIQDEYRNAAQGLPLPANTWLPDIEVMVARDREGSTTGWFVAAKGGNNDESHNHNDIGNYVIYYDGQPLIIDVGRGTYTRKTFSDQRYDIWYNCSEFHNLPTINGVNQLPGGNYKATNVNYKQAKDVTAFSLDMAKSYPSASGIERWQRTIRFNKGKNVQVTDVVNLAKAESITQHIMTCYAAEVTKPGMLVIHYKPKDGNAHDFVLKYDARQMDVQVEKVPLTAMEDEGIKQKWGDNIYRINFNVKQPKLRDSFRFEIASK